ncbi:hypothetical protein P886_2665 [Alteromonadaceae bacterium 2753L.S.0a.02]|nr:hypothetical protein P886_2665 [Alteromonadaceae bacterium 2753L.S.0a.02]
MTRRYHCTAILAATLAVIECHGAEPASSDESAKISEIETTSTENEIIPADNIFDKSRNYVGNRYVALARKLDFFVSRSDMERETNESQLSIRVGNTRYETGEGEFDFNLRTRVDLPGTEAKFKLFIESDPDESKTLAERNRAVTDKDSSKRETSVAGIEYTRPTSPFRWKHSASLGGKFNNGPDILLRYRLRKYWQMPYRWTSLFRQDFWHQSSIGWGETSHLEFTRPIADSLWFNVYGQIEVRDHDEPVEYANVWRLDYQYNKRWRYTYRFGLLGSSQQEKIYDDRFVNFRIGYRLRKEWVYLYLTPEIFYAEANNYRPERSLTLAFELLLTDDH